MAKIGSSKPKKGTLISNLLNRIDGQYLSISEIPASKGGGLIFQMEKESVVKLAASRKSLSLLTYDECEFLLMSGSNLIRKDLTLKMFPELQKFQVPENTRKTWTYVTQNQSGNTQLQTFVEADFKPLNSSGKNPAK